VQLGMERRLLVGALLELGRDVRAGLPVGA
jgi:hypothetical protein